MIRFVLLALSAAHTAGCAAHDPYCGVTAHCVEACGEAPFIQCAECPDGSIPAEDCMDAGMD